MGVADAFCARCGGRQPGAPAAAQDATWTGPTGFGAIPPRTASILCYIPWVGWIASIIVLASDRFRHDRDIRFHAFQGLYLFVAWLIVDQVFRPLLWWVPQFHVYHIFELILLAASIFMMVKASRGEVYALPLFGELAERSVSEHRA